MDTTRKTGKLDKPKEKGFTTILLAGIMGSFLILFFVVGIDFARIYYVKGELQNAADAAALAGAALLDGTNGTEQVNARSAAVTFAGQNKAAGDFVQLASDSSGKTNTLSPINDILVGNWNGTNFDPTRTPVNAVKVRARRTADSPGGPVGLLFGHMVGWANMSPVRMATASFVPPQIGPFPICFPSCNYDTPLITQWGYDDTQPDDPNVYPRQCTDPELPSGSGGSSLSETLHAPPGQMFFLNSSPQGVNFPKPGLAWTNFVTRECGVNPSCDMPNKDEVLPYIKGEKPVPPICGKNICTSNGNINPLLQELEVQFDKKKKVHTVGGQQVTGWRVAVPIVSNLSCGTPGQSCPGAQSGQANPYLVTNFAEVIVTEVVTTGKHGIRMVGLSNPRQLTWSNFQCKEGSLKTKTIRRWVSSLGCQDCALPLPEQEGSAFRLVE